MNNLYGNPYGNPFGSAPFSASPNTWGANPYGGGAGAANPFPQNQQGGFTSNVLLVTSLDEAIMKTPPNNSDIVYFNQGKDEFYRVRSDQNGNKSWKTFAFYIPDEGETATVIRKDLAPIYAKLADLEAKVSTTTTTTPKSEEA